MKKIAIGLILFFYFVSVYAGGRFIALKYAYKPTPVSAISPTKPVELNADKLWSLIQNWRKSQGLQPYIKDQRLCVIAKDRIKDGLDYHRGLYAKYSQSTYVLSENSAWYQKSESQTLNGWLHSASHSAALHASYSYSCLVTNRNNALQIFSNF